MEKRVFRINGFLMLLLLTVAAAATTWYVIDGAQGLADEAELPGVVIAVLVTVILLETIAFTGFTIVNPNQARVIQFFGRYIGSIKRAGFHWTVPLTERTKVSLRVRNFETERLKVADGDGNPVEIAAVVVWRVVDSANAIFAVDDHVDFVAVQAETAVRHLATTYPYETHGTGQPSLRDSAIVSHELTNELRERVQLAGVEVIESRITHLAYASEIAQAMLARQQANAIVAARFKIVEGAVGMVSNALELLREQNVVDLDEEKKAQMVSNLLVVLCGDRNAQPVLNTGTLYG
jgi:regulator of protease activity HflC (stomatin/prohibitin superfamily)